MQKLDLLRFECARKVPLTVVVVLLFLVSSGCSKTSGNLNFSNPEPAMKEIVYRGGIVVFSIPSNWKEEYEPNGGATFYQEGFKTGTLRLSILTVSATMTQRK